MHPMLVAIEGPLKGAVFAIGGQGLSIGLGLSNHACIPDSALSPEHCLIRLRDGGCWITDLARHHRTLVNDAVIDERLLAPGDRIVVGQSLFLFVVEADDPQPVAAEVLSGQHDPLQAQSLISLDDATVCRPPEPLASGSAISERIGNDVTTLLNVAIHIGSISDPESLYWQLLGMLFDVVPAERGAVLRALGDPVELTPVAVWNRAGGAIDAVDPNRAILESVLRSGEGALVRASRQDELATYELGDAQAVLCVPMRVHECVIGALYLDTSDPACDFEPRHLQSLTAVAGIAGLALENARNTGRLAEVNRLLRQELRISTAMVGDSSAMRTVYEVIRKLAASDSTILICGESGTGKELAARTIHDNSRRANGPFVPINCAGLSESLLESELFGHEKGAFTGAYRQKRGYFEIAEGGTIFLDEVSELAPGLQAKLLRVLQEHEFVRVGGTHPIKVDVRVLSATNRDLSQAVRAGRFRQDLYYRLNVVSVTMPSLRERRSDIPTLAEHFVVKCGAKCKRRVERISAEARAALMNYDWPGNVRELENAIERAVVLGSTDTIVADDLPEMVLERTAPSAEVVSYYHESVADFKRRLILAAVSKAHGNITEAAKALHVHPNYLHRLIHNLGLRAAIKNSAA